MAIGECLAYHNLLVDSEVTFAAWPMGWRHLALIDFHSDDLSELSHMA